MGLAATRASVSSGAYERAFRRLDPALEVYPLACPLLVPLVEEGRCRPGDAVIETVAAEYLLPLREREIDTLVLGCTHYPLLTDVIGALMGPSVARACRDLLACRDELAQRPAGSVSCYTSDRAVNFQRLAATFLGEDATVPIQQIDITKY